MNIWNGIPIQFKLRDVIKKEYEKNTRKKYLKREQKRCLKELIELYQGYLWSTSLYPVTYNKYIACILTKLTKLETQLRPDQNNKGIQCIQLIYP